MPRYFFNRLDGVRDLDEEGTDLPDLDAARKEAVIYAAGTLRDRPEDVWRGHELRVEVADETGGILFAIVIVATDLPS